MRGEQTLCGWHAVQAALVHRPDAVLRLFFAERHQAVLGAVLHQLAAGRRIYRRVGDEELERLAGSRAHQGIVAILRAPVMAWSEAPWLQELARAPGVTLALDGVGNPHNLGALARTAAFLGARGLLLSEQGAEAIASTAAWRTAEGGLEVLPVRRSRDLAGDIGGACRSGRPRLLRTTCPDK